MLLFYDFEVFKYDWLVCIIDVQNKKEYEIVNDTSMLYDFYMSHKNCIWVGYNSKGYDQWILKGILLGYDPKKINDWIISGRQGYQFSKAITTPFLINFDVMFGDKTRSLKQLEAFCGEDIVETSVPFDIDRKLTDEELKETIHYCKNDVMQTINVFFKRKKEFESMIGLIKMFHLDISNVGKTKPQISALILGAKQNMFADYSDEFDISFPKCLEVKKYKYIVDWYKDESNRDYTKKLETTVAGIPFVFAWGGVHGAIPQYHTKNILLNVDVSSYYPALMINFGYLSRNVSNPEKYREIRDLRLQYKKEKNPLADPLKIVLNSTYGAMKDQYNELFDPLMANNVCISGQLLLLDLIESLEPYCKIVQANTDGILIEIDNYDKIFEIDDCLQHWQNKTGFVLEVDKFNEIYQKDVNNYILIGKEVKSKGGYVKELGDLDNDLPIVNTAMFDYMVKGISIEDTIYNEKNLLINFQKIVKRTSKYNFVLHNNIKYLEKTFRVFASKDETDTVIQKVKKLENGSFKNPEKFANTPEHCKIVNSAIMNLSCPDWLDKEYYVELTKKRLEQFGVK